MECDWTGSAWQPTAVFDEIDDTVRRYIDNHTNYSKPRRSGKALEHLISNVKACTTALSCSPYSPSLWLDRGKCLLKLQYPELAVGDAYKATLLIKYFKDGHPQFASHIGLELARDLDLTWLLDSEYSRVQLFGSYYAEISEKCLDMERRASILLVQALLCTQSFIEAFEIYTAMENSAADIQLELLRKTILTACNNQSLLWQTEGTSIEEIEKDEKSGAVYFRRYPWMSSELSTRSSKIIAQANRSVRRTSGTTCLVGKSRIRGREADVLGMFAQIHLPSDMRFLRDSTILCADENPLKSCSTCCKISPEGSYPVRMLCCGMKFCSHVCYSRASGVLHKLQCGRNLKPYENARPSPMVSAEKVADDRVLLRVLATLVGGQALHPLQSLILGALTASYDREEPERFSLASNIVRPMDMLTKLGVDVFANPDYDTWVIMTILARISNNSRESYANGRYLIAINPLYAFFNHSCDPNVVDDTEEDDSSSTLTLKTKRRVRAKEELFISYLHQDDLDLPREERNELLRQWIGRDCGCTRCLEDTGMEVEDQSDY